MSNSPSELIVIADIHLNRNWDVVQQYVENEIDFLNPNNQLKKLIHALNQDPNVAAVIFNGDCVDHFFSDYLEFWDFFKNLPSGERPTNWSLFHDLIKRLNKPYVQVPGNHDYRSESYNYFFWGGLLRVNVPQRLRKKISKKIGHHSFRWFFEMKAVLINEKRFNPLKFLSSFESPSYKRLGDYHCIFLNTHHDCFAKLDSFMNSLIRFFNGHRWGVNIRGLKPSDLDFVKETLVRQNSDSFYFFMHAPMINPKQSEIGKQYRLSITNFKNKARKQKIDYCTMLDGRGELLDILRSSDKNISMITSHAHLVKYFLIDKKSLTAKEVTLDICNQQSKNPIYIKHVVTPSLGSISIFDPKRRIGYFKITPDGFKEVIVKEYNLKA
jgi:predicted phosphodiesterase